MAPSGGESNFGTITLAPGFMPETNIARGVSGGSTFASSLSPECRGYVRSRPDHIFVATGQFNLIRFVINAGTNDTTLVIRKPDGTYLCDDDGAGAGTNPAVQAMLAPGTYQIYIGSYIQGRNYPYNLAVTENPNLSVAQIPAPDGAPAGAAPPAAATANEVEPAAPSPPRAPSNIPQEVADGALDPDAFDALLQGNEWAFFQNGVRACSSEDERSLLPPGDDEFERRTAAASRERIVASLEGKVVRFHGTGTLTGTDSVFDTLALGGQGGPFEVYRSPYDFQRHRFTFHIVANSDMSPNAILGGSSGANWPLCLRGTCSPDIQRSTFATQVMRTIGSVGGRDVAVAVDDTEIEWQNFSRLPIQVTMPEAEAAQYASTMPLTVVLFQRFLGLGYHQRCQRSCDVFFGERMCDSQDNGMGLFKRSELLAYEVRVGDRVVAEFVRDDD